MKNNKITDYDRCVEATKVFDEIGIKYQIDYRSDEEYIEVYFPNHIAVRMFFNWDGKYTYTEVGTWSGDVPDDTNEDAMLFVSYHNFGY